MTRISNLLINSLAINSVRRWQKCRYRDEASGCQATERVFYPTKTRAIDGTVINNESSVPHLAKALRHNNAAIEHVDIWNYFNPITVMWDIRVLRLEPQPPDPEMEAVEAASIVRNDRAERFTRLSVAITTDWSAETRIAERRIHFDLNLPYDWLFLKCWNLEFGMKRSGWKISLSKHWRWLP